jgi:DNA-binding CsgD family transcriptional regulator
MSVGIGGSGTSAVRGSRRAIEIVSQRVSTPFVICDSGMHVMYSSATFPYKLALGSIDRLAPLCHESLQSNRTIFHAHDEESVLRIVPLGTGLAGCVAIFVDTFNARGSVEAAARTFGLTKRETEVLKLLVAGSTNGEIARLLFVAASTAGDHVKSVMRKTGTTKRTEVVGKILQLDQNVA